MFKPVNTKKAINLNRVSDKLNEGYSKLFLIK